MNNKKFLKIGGILLLLGVLALFVYTKFLKPEPGMHLLIETEDAGGLEPENMIFTDGFLIGRVYSMQLKKDYSGKIIIDILLTYTDLNIPRDSVMAVIAGADLMGTIQLQLDYPKNGCKNCLQPFDTIFNCKLGSYFDDEIEDLSPLKDMVQSTYGTLDTVAREWKNKNIGDYQAKALQAEKDIKEMMKNFEAASAKASKLMATTTTSIDGISKDAAIVMANFESESMQQIQRNMTTVQTNFKNVAIDKTSKNVENALEDWKMTLEKITQTQTIFTAIVKKLEKGETGSLAQILNDPRFQVDSTVVTVKTEPQLLNYSKLMEDIRLHPEKYTYILKRKK